MISQIKRGGARSGGVLSTEARIPRELECICLWPHGCAQQTWKHTKPNLGIFMGLHRGGKSLTESLRSLAPSQRKRGRAQSSKLLSVAWSFCDQPPSSSPPEALQELLYYDKISCHPGNSEGFRALC